VKGVIRGRMLTSGGLKRTRYVLSVIAGPLTRARLADPAVCPSTFKRECRAGSTFLLRLPQDSIEPLAILQLRHMS
jgi:hypothetical protein